LKRHKSNIKAVIVCSFLISIVLSGCIEEKKESDEIKEKLPVKIQLDHPSILPDWKDGDYHDYQDTIELLNDFNEKYPDLVYVFSIGKSFLRRDIWCIRITNENSDEIKSSCLIDGCIHGGEWEAGEACLYLTEYLLINYANNKTIINILNSTNIYVIPIVNPDGREADDRFTDNGVDPNRNFDVFFGKLLLGHSYRLGKLFGKIKIPVIKIPPNDPMKWYWNCGKYPFSEPETKALSEFIRKLNYDDLSFYVNCHTPLHNILTPWVSYRPPFEMKSEETIVFDYVVDWIKKNTEYDAYRGENLGLKTGGNAMDWCFKEFRIPSFTFEIYTPEYGPYSSEKKHVNLVYWMKTTLPFFMFLLVNIDNLRQWRTPDIQPPLPEGRPPEPM
jgi:hypothetical protein